METLDGVVPISKYFSNFLEQYSEKARAIEYWNANTKNKDILVVSYESSVISDIDSVIQDQYVEVYSNMLWALIELDVNVEGIMKILSICNEQDLTRLYFTFLLTRFPDNSLYFNTEQIPDEIIMAFNKLNIIRIIVTNITIIDAQTLIDFTQLNRWLNLMGLYGFDKRTLQNIPIESIKEYSRYVCGSIYKQKMFIDHMGIYATQKINPNIFNFEDVIIFNNYTTDYATDKVSVTFDGRSITLNSEQSLKVMALGSSVSQTQFNELLIINAEYTPDYDYIIHPGETYQINGLCKYLVIIRTIK